MADYNADNPFEDEDLNDDRPRKESFRFDDEPPKKTRDSFRFDDEPKRTSPAKVPIQTTRQEEIREVSKLPTTTQYHNNETNYDLSADSLNKKEQEIKRREEALSRREQQLDQQEKTIQTSRGTRIPNWPRCRPFIYHNIVEDMPTPEAITLVKRAYGAWFALIACLVINLASLLASVIIRGEPIAIQSFFLSLAYTVVCTPASFLIYRLVYQAARKSATAMYFLYFIFLWFEILVYIAVFILGLDGWGGAGFFLMVGIFGESIAVGVLCLISIVCWTFLVAWSLYIFHLARMQYVKLGGSAAAKKAVGDAAARGIASNPDLVEQGIRYGAKNSA